MNTQKPQPRINSTNRPLEVHSIFRTIQGEGPFVGKPATFIRMAGCNLVCPTCDTDYTADTKYMTHDEVASKVLNLARHGLVVITGGEPFRQNIKFLVQSLVWEGYHVQLETNGTQTQVLPWDHVTIVTSPKTPYVQPKIIQHTKAYKYIIQHGDVGDDGLPMTCMSGGTGLPFRPPKFFDGSVYLQPLDEGDPIKNDLNRVAALKSCMKFGYTLCLQIHKIIGVP